MSKHYTKILQEILLQTVFKYLNVRPRGFELNSKLVPHLDARIVHYGPARTLYKQRLPRCRSLDGVSSVIDTSKTCLDCADRSLCTAQIRLDLLAERAAYRLLLSHTAAKNFMIFESQVQRSRKTLDEQTTRIRVIDRGRWGELRFELR